MEEGRRGKLGRVGAEALERFDGRKNDLHVAGADPHHVRDGLPTVIQRNHRGSVGRVGRPLSTDDALVEAALVRAAFGPGRVLPDCSRKRAGLAHEWCQHLGAWRDEEYFHARPSLWTVPKASPAGAFRARECPRATAPPRLIECVSMNPISTVTRIAPAHRKNPKPAAPSLV